MLYLLSDCLSLFNFKVLLNPFVVANYNSNKSINFVKLSAILSICSLIWLVNSKYLQEEFIGINDK